MPLDDMVTLDLRQYSLFILMLAVLTLGGCTTAKYKMVKNNRFVVSAAKSQFYKYGPAQAYGADSALLKGQKVTMLVREFGFSKIQLADGQTGYVATEDLTQLPPEKATPQPSVVASRGRTRAAPLPERGLDLTDTPAPALPQ